VRGPTITRGYYQNPAANRDAFDEEGYFKTGDIVSCGRIADDNNTTQTDMRNADETTGETAATAKWYIHDRKKELIKVRGFQVSPAELEKVLLQHPAIADAAVIGVNVYQDATATTFSSPLSSSNRSVGSGKDGEQPRAYVVLRPGRNATEAEVKAWCAQHLAKYKALTGGVRFVDALPRNAGGKLLKGVLRKQAAKEAGSGGSERRNMDEDRSSLRAKL